MIKNIFLLHGSKDRSTAEKLALLLKDAKYSVRLGTDFSSFQGEEYVYTPLLSSAAINDETFCSKVQQLILDSKSIIPLVIETRCLGLAAKNNKTKDLLSLEPVDLQIEGLEKGIAKFVRVLIQKDRPDQTTDKADINWADIGLEKYFRRLHARLGFISLSKIDKSQENVQLEQIYIPLMIDWFLSIMVKDYKITNWWIVRLSNIETIHPDDPAPDINKVFLHEDMELGALNSLLKDIQVAIDAGIDSKFEDPSKRPLVLAPPWYDGIKEAFWPIQVIHAVGSYKRLVVLGAPGSGKSTFVRYLALCLLGSKVQPELPNANIRFLSNWPHSALTPLFIELRHFVGWDKFPDLEKPVTEDHFWNYVKEGLQRSDMIELAPILRSELIEGRGIIILDGLDEVPIGEGRKALDRRRQQLRDLARELSTVYANSRIVFTSRDYAYRDWELEGFTSVKMAPLNLNQMNKLANKLYGKKGLGGEDAQNKADRLINSLNSVPATLKDYPLFLTLMATLFLRGEKEGLPTKKGELYYQSIMLLLDRWTQPGLTEPSLADQLGCGVDKLYERLEVVAYKTHIESVTESDSPSNISRALLLDELFEIGGQEDIAIAKLLSFVSEQAGVLISPEARVFQFAHRGFQEYLAASYIYRLIQEEYLKPGAEDDYLIVRSLIEARPQLWREPCLLLGEVIVQRDRKDRIWELIFSLLNDDRLPSQIPNDSARWWSVWLACRLSLDHEIFNIKTQKYIYTYEKLKEWTRELLNRGEALPTYERVEVATLLGFIKDERPGVGIKEKIPDIMWCSIPSGEFVIGTTPEQISFIQQQQWAKDWTFTRETPSHIVELPTYEISRFPITQAQFQSFVDDEEDGYFQRKWWTKAGLEWIKEGGRPFPSDPNSPPNLPCTNVSWYEAVAYCNWLSEKLRCKISLPSEAQWEKAAKGINGRIFPWGKEFNKNFCNSSLSGLGKTVPVGCYKLADNPWGLDGPQDMSGNIWEWCTSIYEIIDEKIFYYPYYSDDSRENMEVGNNCYRICRGGSFLNPPFLLRTAYRGRDRPHHRAKRVGFRVVKATVDG